MHTWLDYVQIVVPSANLFLILFGILKVFNRNETEWREKEHRLATVEADVATLKVISVDLAAIKVSVCDLTKEIIRVRDRLDRFLDSDVNTPARRDDNVSHRSNG
jgi:hypothetical protein